MPISILAAPRGRSAFLLRDAEGAPASNGVRYHAAIDWFDRALAIVRAAVSGEVVEIKPSRGNVGQVFGGVVKVREDGTGRVYVYRHVNPLPLRLGVHVTAGQVIARVTDWAGSSADHVHLEVWRTLAGGYHLENMIDPGLLDWTPFGPPPPPRPPRPSGTSLRLALPGRPVLAGWEACEDELRWIAAHPLKSDRIVLAWKKRKYKGRREVRAVAINFARRGFLS